MSNDCSPFLNKHLRRTVRHSRGRPIRLPRVQRRDIHAHLHRFGVQPLCLLRSCLHPLIKIAKHRIPSIPGHERPRPSTFPVASKPVNVAPCENPNIPSNGPLSCHQQTPAIAPVPRTGAPSLFALYPERCGVLPLEVRALEEEATSSHPPLAGRRIHVDELVKSPIASANSQCLELSQRRSRGAKRMKGETRSSSSRVPALQRA